MLINLVKKDLVLVKKYLPFLFAFAVAAPIFITSKMDFGRGNFIGFLVIAILLEYSLFGTVSMLESKYKGSALLCATPYTRKSLVKAKYLFILVIFISIYIIYTVTAILVPVGIEKLNISTFGICLLVITIYFSIMIPIQYQIGYEKVNYVWFAVIFLSPTIVSSITKWMHSNNISFQIKMPISGTAKILIPYFMTLIIGVISMNISMNIYSKKNL